MGMSMRDRIGPYDFFILLLSIFVLFAMGLETFLPLDEDVKVILLYADNGVCLLFFIDFLYCFITAPNRWRYMKWGWIDLVACMPALPFLRWGRLMRLFRIIRLLRAVRSTKVLLNFFLRRRAQSAFLTVGLVSILVLVVSSIAILQFEKDNGGNIQTPRDAIWWAFVTITTVGYGDKYAVSSMGQVVSAILMLVGVGLFGTFTGFIATWFMADEQEEKRELAVLRREVRELKDILNAIRKENFPAVVVQDENR